MTQPHPTAHPRPAGESTPAGRNLAEWFRQLDQFVRIVRTFGPAGPNALAQRERVIEDLLGTLHYHAPVVLHCTPLEVWLNDEAVVPPPGPLETGSSIERRVPFLLYRDGIRTLTFRPETTYEDAAALLDALARVTVAPATDEDLVTLLWNADLTGLRVDVAPLEESVRVHSVADDPNGLAPPLDDEPPASRVGPDPAESARDAAPVAPPAGFADWPLPDGAVDPLAEWRVLAAGEAQSTADLQRAFEAERAEPWSSVMPRLVHAALAIDPGPDTQAALAHALVTWIGGAVQRCDWPAATQALAILGELDPDGVRSAAPLSSVLQAIDADAVAERLDESEPDVQAQFFALGVRIGRPALDLMVGVLATATRVRLRAAATTALAYLCAEEPEALARFLGDSRWYVVRNIVFVLGQIGGPVVVPLLESSARHGDPRVRRAVVHALGQAPPAERLPLLVAMLETQDAQTVSAALAMLARDGDPRLTAALLERVTALDFEQRPDDVKFALVAALGDTAAADALPALESMLQKGGWFARRTAERTAAAQALARIGTPAALAVLQAGLQSRAEAIRSTCQEALARIRGRAA